MVLAQLAIKRQQPPPRSRDVNVWRPHALTNTVKFSDGSTCEIALGARGQAAVATISSAWKASVTRFVRMGAIRRRLIRSVIDEIGGTRFVAARAKMDRHDRIGPLPERGGPINLVS